MGLGNSRTFSVLYPFDGWSKNLKVLPELRLRMSKVPRFFPHLNRDPRRSDVGWRPRLSTGTMSLTPFRDEGEWRRGLRQEGDERRRQPTKYGLENWRYIRLVTLRVREIISGEFHRRIGIQQNWRSTVPWGRSLRKYYYHVTCISFYIYVLLQFNVFSFLPPRVYSTEVRRVTSS